MKTLPFPFSFIPRSSRGLGVLVILQLLVVSFASYGQDSPAEAILRLTGVQGGVAVHLGAGEGELAMALAAEGPFVVHGLDTDLDQIEKARDRFRFDDRQGRVSFEVLDSGRLPYIDNLINLVVVEDPSGVERSEIRRVLTPNGKVVYRGDGEWKVATKPRPEAMDEWTHYLHDPTGNAVAQDELVGPPQHLQWVSHPRWSRHHDRMASMSALVTSGGRLFYIMDEGSRVSIQLPSDWKLIGQDAFNGSILWKRDIKKWHHRLWPLKSGPSQLARRLVANDDEIYVTLSIDGPTEAVDAATGETRRVYPGTEGTEEILHHEGVLYLLVNKGESEIADYLPEHNVGDQARVRTEFVWNEQPREIHAVWAATGRRLWRVESKVAPITMALKDESLVYHNGEKVICLDRNNGETRWESESAKRRSLIPFNFAPRVVVHEEVVLFAGGEGRMTALDLNSGEPLWESQHDPSGYQSLQDLLVAGGQVWSAPLTSGKHSGAFTGRDPRTGEIITEFSPNVDTYWFHHRCYIAKATENYIMPSRTGIEFVDIKEEDWDINHWVRGGCLYGVMPANGLTYAPPHNCACYPEAKLYGMNALGASSSLDRVVAVEAELERLTRGPAYGVPIENVDGGTFSWPTYRGTNERSGYTAMPLSPDLSETWETELGGRLTALTVAEGKVFVSAVDKHRVYALDSKSGELAWSFLAGARVDSPPTYHQGRAYFGCQDGWVYCLRANDGELVWKYRAAPADRRLLAFGQLESVWPVHGSVLVEDDVVSFVAGRSIFLDGGLQFVKLDAATGEVLFEDTLNDRDPETGGDIQDRIQTLQMPVGLADILSSDGKFTYLRSQRFDQSGQRVEIGPVSGDAAVHGGTQRGEGVHLFAPMGFLDGDWFHRSYWVYGKNFAGGHNGYYQAGKYTPSGRILVYNDKEVYGYGRDEQYLRWTTPLEHRLFAASKEAPDVKPGSSGGPQGPIVTFPKSDSLDPSNTAISVEAWIYPDGNRGVIVAHGGPSQGFALSLQASKPSFLVRSDSKLSTVTAPRRLPSGWSHVAGVLGADRSMRLYVNGQPVAKGEASKLIASNPAQPLDVGGDSQTSVGDYKAPFNFVGMIDEVRVFYRALSSAEIESSFNNPGSFNKRDSKAMVVCHFDRADAKDHSGKGHDGQAFELQVGKGKVGDGLWFRKGKSGNARRGNSFVKKRWAKSIPMFARAMALTRDHVVVAGPPDYIDEEKTFTAVMANDPKVMAEIDRQAAALNGADGGLLWTVSTKSGERASERRLDSLPVWDGMAAAEGRLFLSTEAGTVICLGGR